MEISFEDFSKVDIRSGTILKAERIPKSNKLLKLEVSFGSLGTRQILAGIGKDYSPEDMVGCSPLFVVNLAPRQMMGLESHGMILAAPDADGKLQISMCPEVPDGTQVG